MSSFQSAFHRVSQSTFRSYQSHGYVNHRLYSLVAASNSQKIIRPRRALLYMPVNNPKFIEKAKTLDVDTLVFDMEDAVSINKKEEARVHVKNLLANEMKNFNTRTEIAIRINPCSSGLAEDDLDSILSSVHLPHAIVLPKIQSPSDVIWLSQEIEKKCGKNAEIDIIGMIETIDGVMNGKEICSSDKRLTGMIFGGDDFAATINAIRSKSNHEISFARNKVLLSAKYCRLDTIDIVNINFKDEELFIAECLNGFQLGFSGKQCIHPKQAELAQIAFSPSSSTIEWAVKIMQVNDEYLEKGIGAFDLDGNMIDLASVRQAENVIARAKACKLI